MFLVVLPIRLDLIRDQGERQLDRISKINLSNTKAIDFCHGPDERIKDLVDRTREETYENESKDKIFSVTISDKTFDFNKYTNWTNFGSKIFTKKLSLDNARNEQKEILSMINNLKEKFELGKIGPPLGKIKKKRQQS